MDRKVLVQKFGGTSVATPERRQMVVSHVRRELNAGYQVALVVSATGRRGDPYATDTILDLLRNMGGTIDPRNYSFLFVTGEMISVAIMVHTLQQAGIPAVALTGGMAGIVTDDFHMSAHLVNTDNSTLRNYLEQGLSPVVCGGQGITQTHGDFSIMGRDSSDTSGVIVGVMLGAERVDIYTDVEYVCAVDPLVVENAPYRRYLSYVSALEMARFGAKVIKTGAVRMAMSNQLPLRVRSTFSTDPGTLIGGEEDRWSLVGLPTLTPVQIASMDERDQADWSALEQHVGLVRLCDEESDRMMLCAPGGDTVGMVVGELAASGVRGLTWRQGYSLLSLIGSKQALIAMDEKASDILKQKAIPCLCHEVTERRTTFVVPEVESRAALLAVYQESRTDLEQPHS